MYGAKGWSIDFWAHTPGLSSTLTTDHRYKLVAANENCGEGTYGGGYNRSFRGVTAGVTGHIRDVKISRTKGIILGWRDKGDPEEPSRANGLEFVVLPTVAQNDKTWGKSVCIGESVSADGYGNECRSELGFKVPVDASTLSGYTIGQASGTFAHYVITCDIPDDTISLYVNGQFLASALVSTSFDNPIGLPLNIPTAISDGSFHDRSGQFGEKLYSGVKPDIPLFTPWILGGGFTDGIEHESPPIFSSTFPGFLGTNTNSNYYRLAPENGGGPVGQHSDLATNSPGLGGYTPAGSNYMLPRSGLDGHIGSFKMYSNALTKEKVKINYDAQGPYFEGIKLPDRLI